MAISGMIVILSITACNDRSQQQQGEVTRDTIANQDEMMIDTTASVSYGTVGEAPTVSPDLDTLTHIDKGVKPGDALEKETDQN